METLDFFIYNLHNYSSFITVVTSFSSKPLSCCSNIPSNLKKAARQPFKACEHGELHCLTILVSLNYVLIVLASVIQAKEYSNNKLSSFSSAKHHLDV